MSKTVLVLLLSLLLLLLPLKVVFAQLVASPPIEFSEALAFRNLLELNDFLVVVRYNLPSDLSASPPHWGVDLVSSPQTNYTRNDAFISLRTVGGVLVETIQPPRITPGLAGIYLNAADFVTSGLTWNTGYTVEMFASPLFFLDPVGSTGQREIRTIASTTVAEGGVAFRNRVLRMVQDTERENPAYFDSGELYSVQLQSAGAQLITEAFPSWLQLASVFGGTIELLTASFTGAGATQLQTDISAANWGIATRASNLGTSLGLGGVSGGIILYLVFGLLGVIFITMKAGSLAVAIPYLAVLLVSFSFTGIMIIQVLLGVSILALLMLGVWVFRVVHAG